MSTVDSPVTHTALVAVKSASRKSADWPDALAAGKLEQRGDDEDDRGECRECEAGRGLQGDALEPVCEYLATRPDGAHRPPRKW